MAIDLGQLKQYNAEKGIKFEHGTKAYHIEPTVDQGLAFQVALHERDKKLTDLQKILKDKDSSPELIEKTETEYRNCVTYGAYEVTAPLFESKFHYPTKSKMPRFEGGVLAELRKDGLDWGTIDRLITTLYLSMVNTEDVALEYMKSGKLDKAISIVQEREKAEEAARATQTAPGVTNGTGSDE